MLTKKKKLSKKEIKEDKLVSTYYKAISFYQENKSRILTYGGIFLVLLLAFVYYFNNQKIKNEKAALELSRVLPLYENGSYLEAIEGRRGTNIIGLKKIAEEFEGTENGETAKIFLANAYNFLENFDEAYKYYEDYNGTIDTYKSVSLAGQAGYFAYKKDYNKAAELYLKAARVSPDNALNADYLLNAGVYYLKTDNKDKAKELFTTIQKEYQNSSAFREVGKYLAQIN